MWKSQVALLAKTTISPEFTLVSAAEEIWRKAYASPEKKLLHCAGEPKKLFQLEADLGSRLSKLWKLTSERKDFFLRAE